MVCTNSNYRAFNKFSLFLFVNFFISQVIGQGIPTDQKKPNVILILVDDLKPTLGIYDDSFSKSPNIDQLAKEGMRFNMAYANQAVCVASRYNLMLGKRSTSTGLYRFGINFREIYPNIETLPQVFKNNGYHCEAIGKVYHVGHGNTNDKASWSVPHLEDKVIEYIVPESNNGELTREEALFENYNLYADEKIDIKSLPRGAAWEAPDVLDEAYADGRVARHAIKRLKSLRENQAFFLAIGFARPHLPFSVPKKYWDLYDRNELPLPEYELPPEGAPEFAVKKGGEINNFKPINPNNSTPFDLELKRNLIHGYYASVSYMDEQVGRVMREVKRLGLDENTIILLWGDHGWHLGDHGIWTKHTNYEQATRIPLIISAPGITIDGSLCNQTVETVDLYPTLIDLAGLKLPETKTKYKLDGKSLSPLLKDPDVIVKDHIYHSFIRNNNIGEAIRNKRYRMIRWTNLKNKNKVVYELYDYENDPKETVNIATKNKIVLQKLIKILDAYPSARSPVVRSNN